MEAFRAHRLLISNSNEKTTFQWSKVVSGATFPTNRGVLVFRSGLRFSFWALEVPEPRVRKRHLHFQNWLSTPYNIPPSPPIYCLHLWTSFIQKFRKNQYHRLIVLSESFLSSYSSRERDVSMEVCA